MPEVWRSKSWTVIGRFSGTSSSLPLFSTPTFWSANSGMNFATGSLSRKWPSSISIMMPTERVDPADLAAAGDHHGDAGDGSLVDLTLEGVRHPLQPDRR